MQTRKLFTRVFGLTMCAFLFAGCYTRFGVVEREAAYAYEEEVVYEDDYYEDTETVRVIHHYYTPRYFSVEYFYYDPYDYWYWEPGITITFGYIYGPRYIYHGYYPYWYPPYGPCPPPYVHVGWHHYPRPWHYPPPYVVYTPPQHSPNFGRRPKYIAGRERQPVDSDNERVYAPRSSSGKRTYTSLPKDEGGTYTRRDNSADRRRKSVETDRKVYRRPTNNPRENTSVDKPASSDTRRSVTSRRTESTTRGSTRSSSVQSSSKKSTSSSSRTAVRSSSGSSRVKSSGSRPSSSASRPAVSSRTSRSSSSSAVRSSSSSGSSSSKSSSKSSSSRKRR